MTDTAILPVDETRFAALVDMRERVTLALVHFNNASEEAKAKKKAYEAARDAFEREFDRLVRSAKGEDMPLFNQSDAIAAAEADPVAQKLAERLIDRGHDVNLLVVAGYTEEERNQVAAYLDILDDQDRRRDAGESVTDDEPEMPALLAPEPLTAIEMADLLGRLKAHGIETTPEVIEGFSLAQMADLHAWLAGVETVTAEKGEALTADDLPPVPDWMTETFGDGTVGPEEGADVEAAADEPDAVDEADGDANGAPAPRRAKREKKGAKTRKKTSGGEAHA